MPDKIYTRDEALLLVDLFENVLLDCGIRVPSPEDEEREPEDTGLYGSTYSDLLDGVELMICDLLDRHKADTQIIEGIYSGRY